MSIETMTFQPVIATERFDLRPIRTSDMGLWSLYLGDERVARMVPHVPHPLPPGAAEAFVARATSPQRDKEFWAMDATKTGGAELMGVISLARVDNAQAEIGFWVGPPHWKTGIASDAIAALIAANPLNNCTLFASVFQDNKVSSRVLLNNGFEYVGDAEAHSVARKANVPTWTYVRTLD